MAVRVLILTAGVGEGHDLPARMLADGLRAADPACQVEVADGLEAGGRLLGWVVDDSSVLMFSRANWLFDGLYVLFSRWAPTRRLGQFLSERAGARGLLELVAAERADVVVSTHPAMTDILGRLRARGELPVPAVAVVTDLAGLQYWAHPGIDLHLITEAESRPEVRGIAPASRIAVVRGLTDPAYEQPLDYAAARASVGVPEGSPLVVVSGGGWAVGDLEGAAEAALGADPLVRVVVLCGRSDEVRERIAAAFSAQPRVRAVGFTDRMPELLAAADVLVHSTAGLTAFEARIRGAAVISYGWGVGHIRLNNEAYERLGIATVADDRQQLADELIVALRSPRPPGIPGYGARVSAADEVLALAGAGR